MTALAFILLAASIILNGYFLQRYKDIEFELSMTEESLNAYRTSYIELQQMIDEAKKKPKKRVSKKTK